MAFDFPSSPIVGQQFTPVAGTIYTWNGYAWVLTGPTNSSMVLLSSQTVSGAASVDFTGLLTSQYDEYELHFFGAYSSVNADTLAVRIGQSGVYRTAGSYRYELFLTSDASANASFGTTTASGIGLTENNLLSNLVTSPASGRIHIFNPAGTTAPKRLQFMTSYLASNNSDRAAFGAGFWGADNNAIDSVRVYCVGGGNLTGTFKLYGIAGSALGVVGPSSSDAFHAYRTADQSFTGSSFSKISFNVEAFDRNSKYDNVANFRWTPAAGLVTLYAKVAFSGVTAWNQVNVYIYKNGSSFKIGAAVADGGGSCHASVTATDIANGTDYYEAWIWVPGTPLLSGTSVNSYFWGNASG